MDQSGAPTFRNAQALHRQHPETFEVPSADRLERVSGGSLVKICAMFPPADEDAGGERFWVQVLERQGDQLVGRVDNELDHTDKHGLALHDRIQFRLENIYDVYD